MAAPKLRVLYSEDDPDSRELMCLLLAQKGFEVICPDTSQDVLRIAKEEEFDVYLLDTWTPGMSGVELCKRIREFNAQTPIIFHSAVAVESVKHEALAAGAQSYITKPASRDEIVGAIRSG